MSAAALHATIARGAAAAARPLAAALAAASARFSTSAAAQQQSRAARAADHADEFAKTPLRPRVLSEEARKVAEQLRRNIDGPRRPRGGFSANGALPGAERGGQGAHKTFAHSNQEASTMRGGHEGSAASA